MNEHDVMWLFFISDWEVMRIVRQFKVVDCAQAFAITGKLWTI